jgi:hypothetical protein
MDDTSISPLPRDLKPIVAIKGSKVPFTRKRTAADLKYIAWLADA